MDTARKVLFYFVVVAILFGWFAGFAGIATGESWAWSPRSYVPKPGDCFTPPQGDPLYDAWYSQNVNPGNCDAFRVQSESKFIDQNTETVRIRNQQQRFQLYLFAAGVVIAVITLLSFMAGAGAGRRGSGSGGQW